MLKIFNYVGCIIVFIIFAVIGCEKKNHAPDLPTMPIGPDTGNINITYNFTSSANDYEDDSIVVRFDWGDGDTSLWSNLVGSGKQVSLNHSWSTADNYIVRAQARDYKLNFSQWSLGKQIYITSNIVPDAPSTPSGADSGFVNIYYNFTSFAIDPNDDSVSYQFDWGNGDLSNWSIFVPNGIPMSLKNTWPDSGVFLIRARAKDSRSAVSGWSFGHQIIILKTGAQIPNYVVTTVIVGSNPVGITALPNDNFVYITNNNSNNISVIRTSDNTVFATIPVQLEPYGITVLPNGNYIYVANSGSDNVSVIQTSDNTVTATIPVGFFPSGIASIANNNYVYVANKGSDNVSVIQTSDNTVIATIPVGNIPSSICALPNGNYVYVVNEASNNISVIQSSNNSVMATITLPGTPRGIIASPNSDLVFIAHGMNNVSIIRTSTNTIIATLNVGNGPNELAVLPNSNYVYVTNQLGNNVTVFNSVNHQLVANIPVGSNPSGITALSNGNYVYVVNNITNTVSVIRR